MARRLTTPYVPAWKGDLPVFERSLSNGLKALVLPRRNTPVVVSDLYYPAGSVNEPAGRSGLAHFVEHMLFKGTARLGKGQIDRLAFAAAGSTNAETSEDFSHYWFALPADRWELALEVEADRMTGALFAPDEVEAERQVIAEERAGDLDSPQGRLDQAFLLQSYVRHPYRNPILGWPEDLANLSVDDLKSFYQRHYRPDGAVIVVVGDVEPDAALDRIEAHFASIPRGIEPRAVLTPSEPRQLGRREFELVDSDSVARGLLGWHSVPIGHADAPALSVLADLLCCGRRSRLWDRLVERDRLVTWIDAGNESSRFAGQFLIQVESSFEVEPKKIGEVIAGIAAELADSGPSEDELTRSRRRLEASWRWEQDDLAGLAGGLGPEALWDDWRNWQAGHRAAIAVTQDDIRRVASAYLVESAITVGWSLPRPSRSISVLLPAEAIPKRAPAKRTPSPDAGPLPLFIPQTVTKLTDYDPMRSVLPNGLRVLTERRQDAGVIALELHIDAGSLRELKPGVGALTGRLLDEGTTTRTAEALAAAIEDVGGALEVGSTGLSVRIKAEDLPLAIELMADIVLRPGFPEDALGWTKRRIGTEIQGDRDDPSYRADQVFRSLIYRDHPYGRDARGTLRDVARLTLDDVRIHHARNFVADRAIFAAAGDFDPKQLRTLIKTHFGRWKPATEPLIVPPRLSRSERPRSRRVFHPGTQVHLLMGHLGITRRNPDFEALCLLDQILGAGPGFTDRLSRILRDELGLAYSVGGGMTETADLEPGVLRIYLGTSPEDAERAVAAVVEQVRALHAGDFTDDEVEEARRYLTGAWVFDYQTVEQRADNLLELERLGLPLDTPRTWPDRIAKITPAQVRKAAKLHLVPAALTRVEFGPILRRGSRAEVDCA